MHGRLLINLDVPDLARAEVFYEAALGVTVGRRWDHFTELLGGPCPMYLIEVNAGTPPFPGATVSRSFERHWTPVHLDLDVPKLEPAVERALAAGARMEKPPETFAWGRMATFADPFGHGFCLVELTPEGYGALPGRR